MDLIYANAENRDMGILQDFSFDLAFGEDENDFELKMPLESHCMDADYIIYIEGTEYGGIVDGLKVDTENQTVTYTGRTWHGILDSKIVTPASGEDYYVVSGEANAIVATLLSELSLTSRFTASTEDSGINIPQTNFNRYKGLYTGLLAILQNNGAKIKMSVYDGIVTISVVPIDDYSENEFTQDEISFIIEKKYNTVNHLICLGQGELKDRQRIDLFADEDGNISTTQTMFGIDEFTEVYDYSSVESVEELEKEGISEFKERRKDGEIDVNFDSGRIYDIGDIIGASERITGISVTKRISKKIVSINKSQITVNYSIKG